MNYHKLKQNLIKYKHVYVDVYEYYDYNLFKLYEKHRYMYKILFC